VVVVAQCIQEESEVEERLDPADAFLTVSHVYHKTNIPVWIA